MKTQIKLKWAYTPPRRVPYVSMHDRPVYSATLHQLDERGEISPHSVIIKMQFCARKPTKAVRELAQMDNPETRHLDAIN